jgi:hypothetical protein
VNGLTRTDPIDGPQRYCRQCKEWWPDDGEFWYSDLRRAGTRYQSDGQVRIRKWDYAYRHCRACLATSARRYRERRARTTAA